MGGTRCEYPKSDAHEEKRIIKRNKAAIYESGWDMFILHMHTFSKAVYFKGKTEGMRGGDFLRGDKTC